MADLTLHPPHILVVDDEEGIRLTFGRFVRDADYHVSVASSLKEGLELARSGPVDLVFADIHLGDGTGIDILRAIRKDNHGCPVVLITGNRKGIGRFLVEHFLKKKYLVEDCSRQPFESTPEHYTHHQVDVTVEAQVKSMMAAIQKRHGRLDNGSRF